MGKSSEILLKITKRPDSRDEYAATVKHNKGEIAWNSILLVFGLTLVGILTANVIYFGRYVSDTENGYIQSTDNEDYTGSIPINETTAAIMKVTNGILLLIPLVICVYAIVGIARDAKEIKDIDDAFTSFNNSKATAPVVAAAIENGAPQQTADQKTIAEQAQKIERMRQQIQQQQAPPLKPKPPRPVRNYEDYGNINPQYI